MKKYKGLLFFLFMIFGITFAVIKNHEQRKINKEKIIIKLLDEVRNGTR